MIYPLISALTLMSKLGICIAVFAVLIIVEIVSMALLVKWKKNFKPAALQNDGATVSACQQDAAQQDTSAAEEDNQSIDDVAVQDTADESAEMDAAETEESNTDESDGNAAETEVSESDEGVDLQFDGAVEEENVDVIAESSDESQQETQESVDDMVSETPDQDAQDDVEDTNPDEPQQDVQENAEDTNLDECQQETQENLEDTNSEEPVQDVQDNESEQNGDKKDGKWSAFAFAPLALLSASAQVTSVRYLLYALIGVAVVLGAAVLVTAIAFAKSLTKAPKQEAQQEQQPEQNAAEEPIQETQEQVVAEVAEEEPIAAVEESAEETEEPAGDIQESVAEEEATVEVAEEAAEDEADEPIDELDEEQFDEPIQDEEPSEEIAEEAEDTVAEEVEPIEETQPEQEVAEPIKKPEPVKRQPVPREQTVVVEDKTVLIKDDRFLFNPEEDGWYYVLEKTFTAKLIQSEDVVKDYYTELKNELLSYKKVHARMSKKRESFNFGRNCLVRMTIRGKTLRIHFALDAKDYEDTKYKIEDTSTVKSLADTPLMYRIKNDRRLKYAKELIAAVMEKFGVEKMPFDPVYYNYADDLPYETTPPLIERGLIIKRRVRGKIPEDKGFDFAKKTFKAKLIQSDEMVKDYYSQLKNYLLSYKKIHDRMSKARESYRFGRTCVARMSIRGKTLKLYLALDAADYADSKYTIEDASSVKSVADTPLLIKIKNNRRLKHAMALIDDAMAKVGAIKRLNADETDYAADLPFEETEDLFEQGLIVNVHVSGNSFIAQRMAASKINSEAAADEDEE